MVENGHLVPNRNNVRLRGNDEVGRNVRDWALTRRAEKLHLDFARWPSMCTDMQLDPPHEHLDLIASLCLEAGRIMEDESPALALRLPASATLSAGRLTSALQAGEDIAALAAAAQVLLRRGETGS